MPQIERITLNCSPEMAARIKAAAAHDRRSVSDWIRLKIEPHLAGYSDSPKRENEEKTAISGA